MVYNQVLLKNFDMAKAPSEEILSRSNIISAKVGNPMCEGCVQLYLQILENTIQYAGFKAYGGVTFIAVGQFVCNLLTGMSVNEAFKLERGIIVDSLELNGKESLAADYTVTAIKEALENVRKSTYNN